MKTVTMEKVFATGIKLLLRSLPTHVSVSGIQFQLSSPFQLPINMHFGTQQVIVQLAGTS